MGRIFVLLLVALFGGAGFLIWTNRDLSPYALEAVYTDETSRFIEVEGARIHYRDQGDGPVLLLIHGYSYHLQSWDGWAEPLSQTYRVVRLDLPGHALTGPYPANDYSPEGQTAMVAAFVEALGLKDVTLVGNSLGGLIAWRYAADNPENTAALVLVAPGGFLAPDAVENTPGEVPAIANAFRFIFPEFVARAILENLYTDEAKITKEQVRRYRDLIRREGNRTALLLALRQFALFDPVDKLSQIEAPALILWGVDDQALPVSDAQKFHDALPNSELAIFDNLGHVPMEEAPSQTLPVVQAFLERHLSREEPVDPLEQE